MARSGMPLAHRGIEGSRAAMQMLAEAIAMDSFSPEFSAYWLREPVEITKPRSTGAATSDEALSPLQKAALEDLAEIVRAARRVV